MIDLIYKRNCSILMLSISKTILIASRLLVNALPALLAWKSTFWMSHQLRSASWTMASGSPLKIPEHQLQLLAFGLTLAQGQYLKHFSSCYPRNIEDGLNFGWLWYVRNIIPVLNL